MQVNISIEPNGPGTTRHAEFARDRLRRMGGSSSFEGGTLALTGDRGAVDQAVSLIRIALGGMATVGTPNVVTK